MNQLTNRSKQCSIVRRLDPWHPQPFGFSALSQGHGRGWIGHTERLCLVAGPGERRHGARGDNLNCLLAICPDTDKCKPQEFDFRPHKADNDSKPEKQPEKEKDSPNKDNKKKEKEEKRQRLPRRLLLSAFSDKVGHRSCFWQRAQALLFVERFPTEFTPMAMHQIVLPCSEDFTLPFVTDGGLLPCPCLSTFYALKYLQQNPRLMEHANHFARSQMEKIWTHGVQVEWLGCASLLEWQLHMEHASVQAEYAVKPHVLDAALKKMLKVLMQERTLERKRKREDMKMFD